jgi:predicted naringenin-chalcone synthase
MLRKGRLDAEDFDRLAFHPGGKKVVTALERAFRSKPAPRP